MTIEQRTDNIDRALPLQRRQDAPPPPSVSTPSTPSVRTGLPAPLPQRPARRDILAIQASLAAVRKRPVALAESFYAHLFEIAPAARSMFADDMTTQMQRMTDILITMIAALEDPADQPALERTLHTLGARHRDHWNVVPEHYLYIAHALTRSVRDVAGPAWSGALSSSWIALTLWITGHMLVGHHRDAPEP